MIKLTNNIAPFNGLPVYLNPEYILSVFEEADEEGGTLKTKIFAVSGSQSWTYCIEESPKEVVKRMQRFREGYND